MQGEAILGLEAAARGLVRPGTPVPQPRPGRLRQGHGLLAEGFRRRTARAGGRLQRRRRPGRRRALPDEHPGIELVTRRPLRDALGHAATVAEIGPIAQAPRCADARRLRLVARRHADLAGRVAARRLRRRRPEVPRRASRHVADERQRGRLGARSARTRRAARLVPLDARLEGAVDRRRASSRSRRRSSTSTASRRVSTSCSRRASRRRFARTSALPRPAAPARARWASSCGRAARDHRGLRDRDHGARGARRRAGARPLPRALRRDDLRRPGCGQPRPHRPHGPDGALALPGRRPLGARSDARRPGRVRRGRRRRRGRAGEVSQAKPAIA